MSTETFRQSAQQFRALIEHSTEAIALLSPDGIILYASPSTERVTGYTADELVGMNSFSLVHPNDLERVQERLSSLLDQPGAFTTVEYRFRHQDGTFRWMEGTISNCLSDPSIGAVVSNYHDITERKQTEAERDRALVQVASREREIEAALRRREEQLRLIIDGLPLFISYVDTEHRYQFTNRMHERWFGHREQDIRGHHASQVLGRLHYEEVRPYLERALGGEEVQFEARTPERDGSRGYVHVHYIPDRDEQGQVRGCIVLVTDIAERKQQEEALRASEERYRTIVQTANEGIWLIDREARTLYINDRMAQMLGYTTAEMCEHTVPEFVFPGDEPKAAERINSNLTGTFEQFEFRFRRRDGNPLDTLACTSPVRDGQGRIVGALGMFTDITEQRRLERRTHEALDALLAIAEALVTVPPRSEVALALLTASTLAHRLLELTCRVMGCENATFVSREPDTDVAHLLASVGFTPDQERIIRASVEGTRFADRYQDPAFLAHLHAGEVQLLDLSRPPYRDQRPLPSLRQAVVVPIRLGEVLVGVISLNHVDALHEYTSADLALAQGTARLAGLVIERERLLRERAEAQARALMALQANQHMDAFLGMVGHELKTPLTAMKVNLQLAKRRLAAGLREVPDKVTPLRESLEAVQVLLERAERQIEVENRLVSDLLDSTRIQAGQLDLHLKLADLAVIVREVVEDLRLAATARVIELDLPALETVPILADADRIGQVLSNYLSNAIKYAAANRPIAVRLQVEGTHALLCVQDEGPGLSPAEQERIWERFYRVPGVQRQPGASLGLGLYICRMIIEQHHGQVGVKSMPGKGATFWFTLPLQAPGHATLTADSGS